MAEIALDVTTWPVVVTTPPEGAVTDQELAAFLAKYRTLLQQRAGAKFVSVLDLRRHSGITARQRKMLADWMNDEMDKSPCRCLGSALVFSSSLLRGMMTAILWLRTSSYERRVFATLNDAVAWGTFRTSGTPGAQVTSPGAPTQP